MSQKISEAERRLTAALYAQIPGVLEHVRKMGRLPAKMPGGGRDIGLRVLIEKRGVSLKLTKAERLVFDAIGRENENLPGGHAILVDADTASSPPAAAPKPENQQ